MSQILSITFPIFCVMGIGYGAVWWGLFQREGVRVLSAFVFYIALPALVFRALSQLPIRQVINLDYLFAYGLASMTVFALIYLVSRYGRGQDMTFSAYLALGASACNSGFIGYPVGAMVVGPPAAIALALHMIIENVLVIPTFMALAEKGRAKSKSFVGEVGTSLKKLVVNPLILSIAAGIACSFSGLVLPSPLLRTVDMLAQASGPVALFVIGGNMVGFRPNGHFGNMAIVVVGKLLLFPATVFLCLKLVPGLSPDLRKVMLVMSSVPMITIYPILGQVYRFNEQGSAALIVGTGLSFFTISGLLLLL